jgi:hypothetical protein
VAEFPPDAAGKVLRAGRQGNLKTAKAASEGASDVRTFTAIDAETRLVPSWLVGHRDFATPAFSPHPNLSARLDEMDDIGIRIRRAG